MMRKPRSGLSAAPSSGGALPFSLGNPNGGSTFDVNFNSPLVMQNQNVSFGNGNEDRDVSDDETSSDSFQKSTVAGKKRNGGKSSGNATTEQAIIDPKASLDRDTKRMLIGLMFPVVEVVGGILLDRYLEFDVGTIVIRSLVDNSTAGGVLSVITTKGAELIQLVRYDDTNFFHITIDGVSQTLCAPTTVHLPSLLDIPKMEGGSISLYSEADDVAPRLATSGVSSPPDPTARTLLDGFQIPKVATRSLFGNKLNSIGALLQQDALHGSLIGPNTTLKEVEARFESLMSFALQAEVISVPTLHSVVTLPLSTARYISEIGTRRQATIARQQAEAAQRHSVKQDVTRRQSKDFYHTIVSNVQNKPEPKTTKKHASWESGRDASEERSSITASQKFKGYFDRHVEFTREAPMGGSLPTIVPPVQFAVDELCLLVRQSRSYTTIAAESLRLKSLLDAYEIGSSYDNAAHLVPCVCNLLEVMVDDNVDEALGDILGGLVVAAVNCVLSSNIDVVFFDVRPSLSTLLISVIRKFIGNGHEEATSDLLSKAAGLQTNKVLPLQASVVSSWENAAGLAEVERTSATTNLSQWLPASFNGAEKKPSRADGTHASHSTAEHKIPVLLPSLQQQHHSKPQVTISQAPLASLLPDVIEAHRHRFVELLLPPSMLKRDGIYSCIAAVLGTLSELDILLSLQMNHFPDDCNDNVALMNQGRAKGVDRTDTFGYTGHSTQYILTCCHAVRSVRNELRLGFPQIPLVSGEVAELTKTLLFSHRGAAMKDLVVSLKRQTGLVPKPLSDNMSKGAGSQDEGRGVGSTRLSTQLGDKSVSAIAQRLWPAILCALSIGSHILNDCTCWTGPILTPFENMLFEEILNDMCDLIIQGCHMLWALPPQLSGPMLSAAMTKFTSVLRRASASWFDLVGVSSIEAKSKLTQAATAVLITKSVPRVYLPATAHDLANNSPSDVSSVPASAYITPTKHLLHAPVDWLVRATSASGGIAEHAIVIELHQFYCASVFWLDPLWWTRKANDPETLNPNVFSDTWVAVDSAVRSVRDLMPSPSPALLLWDSVCRITGAYATLQVRKECFEERVLLSAVVYEAFARQQQQGQLVVEENNGFQFIDTDQRNQFSAMKSSIDVQSIRKLADGQEGWEGYASFYSQSPSTALSRKHRDESVSKDVLPALIYILGWISQEIVCDRPRSAAKAASFTAQKLSKVGVPLQITDAFSQLALSIVVGSDERQLMDNHENMPEALRLMHLHYNIGIFTRLDIQSAAFATPILSDPFRARKREIPPQSVVKPMISYKGETPSRYSFDPDMSDDDGSLPRSRTTLPPSAVPLVTDRSDGVPTGLNTSRSTSPHREGGSNSANAQWPEVRQVSRLASSGAVGRGANMFRKLQRVADDTPLIPQELKFQQFPKAASRGGVSARKIDVLDLLAQTYR